MKIYLLYYDTIDSGSREEWNTFYTPVELFTSDEDRKQRINFIKKQVDRDGNPVEYEFYKVDKEIMVGSAITVWDNEHDKF
jgi:hypothetical protein